MFYEKVFSPLLKKHEKKINEIIENVKSGAAEVVSEVASPENIAKAEKLVEQAKEAVDGGEKDENEKKDD